MELSPPNIVDWKNAATSFSSVGVHGAFGANLIGAGEPERIVGARVTADLLPTLGVPAALGRTFAPGEDSERAPRTVVLSDRLWRSVFGADPGVLGRTVVLDDAVYTVIGVMPRGFAFPTRDAEVWVPLVFTPQYLQD